MPGIMIIYLTCIFGLFMLLLQFGLRYLLDMETTAEAVFHRSNKAQTDRFQEVILKSLAVLILIDSQIHSSLLQISAAILFFMYFFVAVIHAYILNPESNEYWIMIVNRFLTFSFIGFLIWMMFK